MEPLIKALSPAGRQAWHDKLTQMVDENEHLKAALETCKVFGYSAGAIMFQALINDHEVKGYRTECVTMLYNDWRLLTRAYIERNFPEEADKWHMAL